MPEDAVSRANRVDSNMVLSVSYILRGCTVSTVMRRRYIDRPTNGSKSACNCPSKSNRTAEGGRYDRLGRYTVPAVYKFAGNNSFHQGDSIAATIPFVHRIRTDHIPAVAVYSRTI
jgi:hypothetical protein